jgi:hypothetical protein
MIYNSWWTYASINKDAANKISQIVTYELIHYINPKDTTRDWLNLKKKLLC